MEQRTEEWFAERLGKLTASRMAAAMSYVKSGDSSAARKDAILELALERITKTNQGSDLSRVSAVQWGVEQEPFAKEAISIELGLLGDDVGFVLHPTIPMLGASPDWVMEDGRPVEIKCPTPKTHFLYLKENQVPKDYLPQMALQCLCLGVESGTFASFDPRFPEHLRLFVCEFKPKKEYLKLVESEAIQFLKEVDEVVKQMENLKCHQ